MSIITDFHSWLARRRTKRRSEDFRRGYDFAFTNLCRGNNTPDDLKAMQTADRTAFDDGMDAAIEQYELVPRLKQETHT